MENVLECAGLGVSFGGKRVLDGLDMAVAPGEFLVVNGPSGSGKSTLLRLLCRLQEPDAGRVLFKGRDVAAMSPPSLRRHVAYVQQTPVVVEGSVRNNLLLPFSFSGNSDMQVPGDDRLRPLLDGLNLDISLEENAMGLSVGQRQRLSLLRTLLMEPEVLLMDEPTSALDPESARLVLREAELRRAEQGMTVLMITHSDLLPETGYSIIRVADGKAVRQ